MNLKDKKCGPCNDPTIKPFSKEKAQSFLEQIPGWELLENKIQRDFSFKDFKEAMAFVNAVADIAEEEQHHPDIFINYNKVTIELWTHSIGGLHENDFIIAAKINGLS